MKKILLSAVAVLGVTSCAVIPSQNGMAIVGDTKEAVIATNNSAATKTGKACAKNYLGIFASGDASIEAAKKNGRITRVSSVDREVKRMLIIAENCTIVKGN
ncbi:MAG: TRL-like family protein [Alphaproteobacteria bacterium]|jgi:hypothetical protein|nr:TRL-like family protein [Alphaproteobacteria bacterium]